MVLCLLPLHACTHKEDNRGLNKAVLNLKASRLIEIPVDAQVTGVVVSPVGHKAVYAIRKGERQLVVDGGREGSSYDAIRDFTWSRDGRRYAYIGAKNGKLHVVVESDEGPPFDDIGPPVFSPDGSYVAYEAMRDGKWYIAAGRKMSRGSDMNYMEPVFSPDGKFISYFEQHYTENRTFRVVSSAGMSDRREGREHEATSGVAISPDGNRIAYVALTGKKAHLVSGGIADVENERIVASGDAIPFFVFSRDSRRLAYLLEEKGKQLMVVDGMTLDYSGHAVITQPVLSFDGERIASVCQKEARNGVKQYVLLNGRPGPLYDEIGLPVFSPDGSVLTYIARRGEKEFIVVDGREGPAYDKVVSPVFSPDGSRLAYRVRQNGKRFVVMADNEGKTIREFDSFEVVWQPIFSPDSRLVAYGAAPALPVRVVWWKVEPVNGSE